jgi:hypothetical protein
VDSPLTAEVVGKLAAIKGVMSVRTI